MINDTTTSIEIRYGVYAIIFVILVYKLPKLFNQSKIQLKIPSN